LAVVVLTLAGLRGSSATAQEYCEHGHHGPCFLHGEGDSIFPREKTLKRGEGFKAERHAYTTDEHTLDRAGCPQLIGRWAAPAITERYCGGYIGGGTSYHHGGEPRCANEGTWGWDYVGGHLPRRVFLFWSHGRRYQGGTGYYQTEAPCEVPNPLSIRPLRHFHRGGGEGESGGE
jgi:hypothetical protein